MNLDGINNLEETLDEEDDDVVNYIVIEEDSFGNLTWDSSYEDLDEFMAVLNVVAEEVHQPETQIFRIH
jgi:hypothetical protein